MKTLTSFLVFATGLILAFGQDEGEPEADHILRLEAMIDVVAEHHVEAPARQQMVLTTVRALYKAGDFRPPGDLTERVSRIRKPDEFAQVLREAMGRHLTAEARGWAARFASSALLESLPGECSVVPAKEYLVQDQLAANRYVGVGIALSKSDGVPTVSHLFEDGPLAKSGGRDGDQIWRIDGKDVRRFELTQVIDLLRGPRGSKVSIALKGKNADPRMVDVVRDVVPMKAISHQRRLEGGQVEYLGVQQLGASVAHELRQMEPGLLSAGVKGVILDLRGTQEGRVHDVKLLADALLPGGVIGRIDDGRSEPQILRAGEDAILGGMELAVLVDRNCGGTREWLAAILQHNNRAVIVGDVTPGLPYAIEGFEVAGMDSFVKVPTAILGIGEDESLVHWRVLEDRKRAADPKHPWRKFTGERWGVEPNIWVGGDFMNEALRAGIDRDEVVIRQALEELEKRIARAAI